MTRRRYGKRSGFTLMELLVAVSLMVFLMTIVVQVFMTSTDIFNRAKAKTEIYQNARYALDRMGKEINNCLSMELGNQDFRLGAPRSAGSAWYGGTTSFSARDDMDGFPVTAPYLVMITSTSWIEATGKQVVGSARVVYRLKKNPVPDTKASVTCTLQRVLYVPDASKTSLTGTSNRLPNSTGSGFVPNIDYCQFIYYEITPPITSGKAGVAHFDIQHFVADPAGGGYSDKKYYQITAGSEKTFLSTKAAPFDRLPSSVRVLIDVIDEKDREIRTLSRQYLIYSAKLK